MSPILPSKRRFMSEDILPGYVRVSDILKPYSKLDGIPISFLEKAADRGTRVHEYCTEYSQNVFLSDIDEDCLPYVNSFIKWFDEKKIKLLYIGDRMYHHGMKVTGEYDLIVDLGDGKNTLLDLKTSAKESKSWSLQLAAYKFLVEHNFKMNIERRCVLMLPKTGSCAKLIEYQDHLTDQSLFISAVYLYHHFN